MQSDSQETHPSSGDGAGTLSARPGGGAGLSPHASRKLAWAIAACAVLALGAATVWAVRLWQTDQAIANVGSSVVVGPAAAPRGAVPSGAPVQRDGGGVAIGAPAEPVAAAPAGADRLPPLVLPGQPVPQAVLRDLPEWVAAQVSPAQTSGASGDESAGDGTSGDDRAVPAHARRRAAPARADGYGAVFARCPGPGESGAVECRRAVCAGAARKAAACAPYLP
jgi:hypothetical protein